MKLLTGSIGFALLASLALIRTLTSGGCDNTCVTNEECGAQQMCLHQVGACDSPGTCEALPDACPDVWSPVCGCDGQTYSNECYAQAAGISVSAWGECPTTTCWDNSMCSTDSYCLLPGCGAKSGTCEPRPDVCTEEYAPVCGCDGKTYGNKCAAAAAGATVSYEGECKTTSCFSDKECGSTSYCQFNGCAAETGSCQARPDACTKEYMPVCGCDGVTYDNKCFAAQAGMSVAYDGACQTGCYDNSMCAKTEYCFFKDCGLKTGTCLTRPEACITLYDPVCGCNGKTYSNDCVAASDGMSVDYAGECTSSTTPGARQGWIF